MRAAIAMTNSARQRFGSRGTPSDDSSQPRVSAGFSSGSVAVAPRLPGSCEADMGAAFRRAKGNLSESAGDN